MSDQNLAETEKKSSSGLILGLVLAVLGGAGGYVAMSMDVLGLKPAAEHTAAEEVHVEPAHVAPAAGAFLEIPPIIVMNGKYLEGRHLRFRGNLEVPLEKAEEVRTLMPRVVDILQGYLRVLKPAQFDQPGSIALIRKHLLARVRLVVGDESVTSLLIMELVPN